MDAARKNNDCYFYYYSTCLKGDGCTFRHEPSALGSETVCSFWAQGKCMNVNCNFRHMELKKNRKTIPCYWESQPSGCQKSHCSFQHKSPRQGIAGEINQSNDCDGDGTVQQLERPEYRQRRSGPGDGGESSEGEGSRRLTQDYTTTIVDPLVVNFEEESDNESVPTSSPTKKIVINRAKTLEEMHLERIQAESAAYYSYDDSGVLPFRDLRQDSVFKVSSLAEIRANKMDTDSSDSANGICSRVVKSPMQIRAERNARDKVCADDLQYRGERGIKRKQEATVRSYKKRAHSPITFDISQAEPSVNLRVDNTVIEPFSKARSPSAISIETDVKMNTLNKSVRLTVSSTGEVTAHRVDSNSLVVESSCPSTTSYARVRLRRTKPVVSLPTNGSNFVPTSKHCISSAAKLGLNLDPSLDNTNNLFTKSILDAADGNSVDSGTLSDLITSTSQHHMDVIDISNNSHNRNELQFEVSSGYEPCVVASTVDDSDDKNVSISDSASSIALDSSLVDSQCMEDSCTKTVQRKTDNLERDDSIDEEMLLDDTNLQSEDIILQEDIDALLDD